MASNSLPISRDRLFALCNFMCDGLHHLESSVGVKQNTEAVLRAAYAAALASDTAFDRSLTARKEAYAALAEASETARVFLTNARKRLSKFLGDDYSTEWGEAGWPTGTLAIPRSHEDRVAQIAALKLYFIQHPEQESADMDATATMAETVFNAMNTARAQVGVKMTASGDAKNARDVAEANLRRRASGLVGELGTLLSGDDTRWDSFGLNRPADPETPEAPTVTTVTLSTVPGMLLVDWNDTRRADHYRVWKQVVGVDEDFIAVTSPTDSDATLTGLPSGATVKVRVTAVNDAGESTPGIEVQTVMP